MHSLWETKSSYDFLYADCKLPKLFEVCHSFIVSSVILGEEIVAGDDLYGGSDRLLSKVIPKTGILVKLVYFFSFFFSYLNSTNPYI